MSRTDTERLCDFLARCPEQRALKRVLREKFGWDAKKLDRVIGDAAAKTGGAVAPLPRGLSVRYHGIENRGGAGGVGLYSAIETAIRKYWVWGNNHGFPKVSDPEFQRTSSTGSRTGQRWVCPDLVLRCGPGRRPSAGEVTRWVHTFEIETTAGFEIQSVYQAHAQGRGADYSWVIFHRADIQSDQPPHNDWDRIDWVSSTLGIGLIGFTSSTSVATWHVFRSAKRRDRTVKERTSFDERFSDHPRIKFETT